MTRWEYKREREIELQGGRDSDLGREGWELVTVVPDTTGIGSACNVWVFKRPLGEFGGIRQFTSDGREISR